MLKVVDVTMSPDTSILASGDLIADTQVINLACKNGAAALVSLLVVDKDDQKAAFDVYLHNASGTMGTENSGPSISDANGAFVCAIVPVATADYKDLGGVSVANIKNIWAVCPSESGSANLYVSIVNGSGTPTYTASGLVLRFGFEVD